MTSTPSLVTHSLVLLSRTSTHCHRPPAEPHTTMSPFTAACTSCHLYGNVCGFTTSARLHISNTGSTTSSQVLVGYIRSEPPEPPDPPDPTAEGPPVHHLAHLIRHQQPHSQPPFLLLLRSTPPPSFKSDYYSSPLSTATRSNLRRFKTATVTGHFLWSQMNFFPDLTFSGIPSHGTQLPSERALRHTPPMSPRPSPPSTASHLRRVGWLKTLGPYLSFYMGLAHLGCRCLWARDIAFWVLYLWAFHSPNTSKAISFFPKRMYYFQAYPSHRFPTYWGLVCDGI